MKKKKAVRVWPKRIFKKLKIRCGICRKDIEKYFVIPKHPVKDGFYKGDDYEIFITPCSCYEKKAWKEFQRRLDLIKK